ncbi:hypothetical protein [Jeotgalicoccus halotolerans]
MDAYSDISPQLYECSYKALPPYSEVTASTQTKKDESPEGIRPFIVI